MDEQNSPNQQTINSAPTPPPVQPSQSPLPPTPPAPPLQPSPLPANAKSNTGMAVVAYIIFFIPLLTEAKNDKFVRFHVRQGFGLFIIWAVLWVISRMIPFYWWFQIGWLFSLLYLGILVLTILGIINAANGKEEPLPLIGQYASKLKI